MIKPQSTGQEFLRLIICLVSLHACLMTSRVASSLWVLKAGLGDWTVGLLLSLFSVGPLVLSLWSGRLADRHGFHLPMGISATLALTGTLVAGLYQSLETLAVCALLNGAAVSVGEVAIQRTAGRMAAHGADLRRVFSGIALASSMSNALAPAVAGLVIDYAGFSPAFLLAAALPVVAWWIGRVVPREDMTAARKNVPLGEALQLLSIESVRKLLLVNLLLAASWDVHFFSVPVIGHERGMSASSIGAILASCALGATLARALIARWSDRFDERLTLLWVTVVTLVMLVVYCWLPGAPGMMAGSVVLGMAIGSVQPMILSAMHKVTPPARHGQILGLRMLATNGATAGMPLIFGALATLGGAVVPMWMIAGMLGLSTKLLRKPRGQGQDSVP
jgi:MFS family permease